MSRNDNQTPVLSGRDLNKEYTSRDRKVRPLQHVDFDLYPGEILGIVGESGSGKSTLLNVISGIEKPDSEDCSAKARNTPARARRKPANSFRWCSKTLTDHSTRG